MATSVSKLLIIAPFLAASTCAWASDSNPKSSPFGFNVTELDSIQFTRSKADALNLSGDEVPARIQRQSATPTRQTEYSFNLKPKRPDFSSAGAYGLGLFSNAEFKVNSQSLSFAGINLAVSVPKDGLEYSAGLKIEQDEADVGGSAYVSSSMLGLSYGRLGKLWYGGIDVNLEQFANGFYGSEQPDVLSLDVTTGRRLGFTGLSTHSPLWLLSVQGNFDMDGSDILRENDVGGDWYLNPSLFWQQPGFTFSAQMQVPIQFETLNAEGEPDYRLRAVFEKQFK
ncbi:MAG: hypothetical protein ACI9XK_000464 [Granulosicoccus sp.]|jgi:hypothetical protein